jgi:polysaccharide export outer membrane protein
MTEYLAFPRLSRLIRFAGAIVVCLCLLAMVGCADTTRVTAVKDGDKTAAPEYHIGPGDTLNIYVFNQPELSINVQVRPDGLISTPLVENMPAAGKTPSQVGRDIEGVLAEYVRSPKVNVIVTNFVGTYGDQIRVVGQAAHPQALAYRGGMTLLDVMITVGGLGEFAAGNRARIVRRTGDKQLEIKVRLDDLVNKGDIGANVPMLPGDVLIIPQSRF